jgi:hypothetical protein
MPFQDNLLFPCPCCNHQTITERGCYEICDLCGWEDDPVQSAHPGYPGGANQNSLLQAQDAWAAKVRSG